MSVSQEGNGQQTVGNNILSGCVINNRYKLCDVIGKGSFADIILARDKTTDEMVAVKVIRNEESKHTNSLEMEYNFYQRVGSKEGFPRVYFYGIYKNYKVMVLELLGFNLQSVFNNCNQQFSLKTILYVFIQLLQRIEHVHNCHLVYRDIKPENFLLGREGTNKENIIHIIDFGLTKLYINEVTKEHIPMIRKSVVTGTARYLSINGNLGKDQSRRDDLEALGYMMMYLMRQGQLPWMGIKSNSIKERLKKIGLCKRGTPIETLCYGYPEQFAHYFRYVRCLEFEERPDYSYLKSLFIKLFKKEDYIDDGFYYWN